VPFTSEPPLVCAGDQELADLVGVRHPARLEDVDASVALPPEFEIADVETIR
jgi:hypothetical protein